MQAKNTLTHIYRRREAATTGPRSKMEQPLHSIDYKTLTILIVDYSSLSFYRYLGFPLFSLKFRTERPELGIRMLRGYFLATRIARGLRVFGSALFLCALLASAAHSQAPKPYLFGVTSANSQYGTVTFLRDDVAGPLTLFPNSASTFSHNCYPTAIDPRGRFLYSSCGDGVGMYTLDSTTGAVSEVPTSPYAASTGLLNFLVFAESTGQFVYLIKSVANGTESTSNLYLDTFQVDSAAPALIPLSSAQLSVAGTLISGGIAADPNGHGIALFLNQNLNSAQYSAAVLYSIIFDPISGSVTLDPTGGQSIGQNARKLAISPTGNFLVVGYGAMEAYFTVYQIGQNTFTLASLGNFDLGPEFVAGSTWDIPGDLYFSPSGDIVYVQAPPANFTGQDGLPFLVFDTATFLILPSSPIPISAAAFIGNLEDPQGPFVYTNAPTGGISVFTIDPVSGLPSQPSQINGPFYPQLGNITPVLAPFGPGGGQPSSGPVLSFSTLSMTFTQTTVGQTSAPQLLSLKNIGNQTVSLNSISLAGINSSDFHESDNCMNPPALSPSLSCLISISYAPAAVGTSQASLSIASNAVGSPQVIAISGTAVAPAQPAPLVSLNLNNITFPGSTTQGTSSSPIVLMLTNSGNAPLHITGTTLGGNNAPDFSLGVSNCSGTLNASANCTLPVTFTPLAAGIRFATITITDDAAGSPQTISVTGTALPSVTVGAASSGGNITASVSAGQLAQFNLQANPGVGFSGTLTFTCSGSPLGAACTVPSSLVVSNGSAVTFTVTVSTSGSSSLLPSPPGPPTTPVAFLRFVMAILAAILMLYLLSEFRSRPRGFQDSLARLAAFTSLFFALGLSACGGGSSGASPSTPPPPPPVVTPSGTYTITVTPTATPAGSTKQFALNALQLTLTVK
jgi:centrosomal CEP192-like protein